MTDEPRLHIKFDGRDADAHIVDMRLLGRSLTGFDRIISDGVIFLSENRLPRHGERARLFVKAEAPRVGSQDIVAHLVESAGVLALGWKIFTDSGGQIISDWVGFVLEYYGGSKSKSDKHLDAIMETQRLNLAARDKSEVRLVEELGAWRQSAMSLVAKLGSSSINATAPVGPSTRSVTFRAGEGAPVLVDEAMADAIRLKGDLELGDLQTMVLRTDGFTAHSRVLNVEHPDEPGRYLSANVKDPAFEQVPNAYTDAARIKATISVQAKPGYRDGRLERIYIMDFGERLDDAA